MFNHYEAKRRKWSKASAVAMAMMSAVTLVATAMVLFGLTSFANAATPDNAASMARLMVAPDLSAPLTLSREAGLPILLAGLIAMSAAGVALARSLVADLDAASRRRF